MTTREQQLEELLVYWITNEFFHGSSVDHGDLTIHARDIGASVTLKELTEKAKIRHDSAIKPLPENEEYADV